MSSKWLVCLLSVLFPAIVGAAGPDTQARELAWSSVRSWIASPAVLDRVKEQNLAQRTLSEQQILALDEQWRRELKRDQAERALINRVMTGPLSALLREKADGSGGLIREVFVMDDKGLLVGTNRVTSDYWQGDEDKWIRVFRERAEVHVGEVSRDESTQTYLVQVSFPIRAPGSIEPIGVLTVGINAEKLVKGAGNG